MAVKAVKKKVAKKARGARATPGAAGVHHIEIDSAGNATVTTTPNTRGFVRVRFTTNRRDSAIRYTVKSPFNEMGVREVFQVGLSTDLFECVRGGGQRLHFECGHIQADGQFALWGDTGGGDTPVDPNVPPG